MDSIEVFSQANVVGVFGSLTGKNRLVLVFRVSYPYGNTDCLIFVLQYVIRLYHKDLTKRM